jgi:hypothetical protein
MSYIDHIIEGIAQLPGARRTPRVVTILTALLSRVQEVEDTLQDLQAAISIDSATGGWLDLLGRIVGEGRAGLADLDYRRFIRARIAINASEGGIEQILTIAQLLTDGIASYYSAYPAAYWLLLNGPVALTSAVRQRILERLREATSAGVGVGAYDATDITNPFILDLSELDSTDQMVTAYE